MRRLALLVFAFATYLGLTVSAASAQGHEGKIVWFSNLELGDGDEVKGNLDVVFGTVTCDDGAVIHGDVHTFFGHFEQNDGCAVDGRVATAGDFESLPWFGPVASGGFPQDRGFFKKLAWDVVVAFAFLLFPLRVRIALDRVEKHPGLSGITGAVVMVAALPVCVLLALSVIGIPLIPIEAAVLCAGLWIGNAALGLLARPAALRNAAAGDHAHPARGACRRSRRDHCGGIVAGGRLGRLRGRRARRPRRRDSRFRARSDVPLVHDRTGARDLDDESSSIFLAVRTP